MKDIANFFVFLFGFYIRRPIVCDQNLIIQAFLFTLLLKVVNQFQARMIIGWYEDRQFHDCKVTKLNLKFKATEFKKHQAQYFSPQTLLFPTQLGAM
jgi:hypothetical protein